MSIAYLNGSFTSLSEAKISPMDRGFLFGDGVYEVIPCYEGQLVAMPYHLERLNHSLSGIALTSPHSEADLLAMLLALVQKNGGGNLGVYLQITRGPTMKRQHAFPEHCQPTVFAYTFPISEPSDGSTDTASCFTAVTKPDKRWERCHIKSTALLGNVLHMMEAVEDGAEEVLLFNEREELTEAAACNVFIVSGGAILTPELDHQILPGVTRRQCIELLQRYTDWTIETRPVHLEEVLKAEEIWLSSSTKELAPVVKLNGVAINEGVPGPRWEAAQSLFQQYRFSDF